MIFILDPASFLQRLLEKTISARNDEYLLIFLQAFLLLPLFHICDICKYFELGHIPFHECFQIRLDELLDRRFLFCWRLIVVIWRLLACEVVQLLRFLCLGYWCFIFNRLFRQFFVICLRLFSGFIQHFLALLLFN